MDYYTAQDLPAGQAEDPEAAEESPAAHRCKCPGGQGGHFCVWLV